MSEWTKKEQYDVLLKFFYDCVRFWEHELKTDSDLDQTPYINALKEIPECDPRVPHGKSFDNKIREDFIKSRYMDTYGRNWEKYYNNRNK